MPTAVDRLEQGSDEAQVKAAVSDCTAAEVRAGTPQDQAVAMCSEMAKKKTVAPPTPEKRLHLSRPLTWVKSKRDGRWMFMFSRNQFCFSAGWPTPEKKVNRWDCPESLFSFRLRFKPFQFLMFKHVACVLALGYKPWKGPMGWEQIKSTL